MNVRKTSEKFYESRFVDDLPIRAIAFDLDMPVLEHLDFPAFTRHCGIDHDRVVADAGDRVMDTCRIEPGDDLEGGHAAIVNGSSPASRVRTGGTGTARGGRPRTFCAIAAICAGVDPQQPPSTLTCPATAHSPTSPAVVAGS